MARELGKLRVHEELWSSVGWYQTRGGFRLLWLLPVGTGRLDYLRTLTNLRNFLGALGLVPDKLIDFGRCYRLPSVCREGKTLEYAQDFSRLGQLPELPEIAVAETEFDEDFAGVDNARIGPFQLPDKIPDGTRGRTLSSYAAQLRYKGYDLAAVLSALMLASSARCEPPVPVDRLKRIVKSISRIDPDPQDVGRPDLDEIVIRKGHLPELVDAAQSALARDGEVYQRGGELVVVQRDPEPTLGGGLGAAHVRAVDKHALRARLAGLAQWVKPKKSKDEWTFHPADVPVDVVDALRGRREWPDLQPLIGVVETPTMRPDGSVLDVTGYDEPTGLVFSAARGFIWPPVVDAPTLDDARWACASLREIVCDFPFAKPAHESVALAAILTTIGRPAVDGATPLFLFDATTPGTGKSLLAHVVATLATGHSAGVMIPTEQHEQEKRTTALLLAGERVILIDNVDRPLGGAAVDAAITADIWHGRRLGLSEMVRVLHRSTWIATGNNIAMKGDLARRCLRVYLVPGIERPEERGGFRHPDLLAWVRRERGRLVSAALTLLRAYVVAGMPAAAAPRQPFGGFGAWSRLVRGALMWVGLPDPNETRSEIREVSDGTHEARGTLLGAWFEVFGPARKTVRAVLSVVEAQSFGGTGGAQSPAIEQLREGLIELAGDKRGEINPRQVGWALRRMVGRVVDGLVLERISEKRAGAAWRVQATELGRDQNPAKPAKPAKPA
jgi:hypothetical protein